MDFKFTFLIFQDGVLDETVEAVQSFSNMPQAVGALARFAAEQSPQNMHPEVREFWSTGTNRLRLPKSKGGYGPKTVVAIKEVHYSDKPNSKPLSKLEIAALA